MKICLAQTDIKWEDKQANMLCSRRAAEQASAASADFVVFPELSLTGFSHDRALAEPPDGETVSFYKSLSAETGIFCGFGFACIKDGRIYNRFAVTNPEGWLCAYYDKLHPFRHGGEIFCGGNDIATVSISDVTIGLTICYDLRFPELFQRLSSECDCIVNIASWPETRADHWTTLLKARAIENQCFVAGCNRKGSGGGITYSGGSAVFSPDGKEISACDSESSLFYADISRDAVEKIRGEFPLKKDRRTDLYINFYK